MPALSLDRVRDLQMKDRVLQGYITWLEGQELRGIPADVRPLLVALQTFTAIDGVLYHLPRKDRKQPRGLQLVVPQELRLDIMRACHDSSTAGHMGVETTYDRIWRRYWWPNVYADVLAYCRSCPRCAARNRAPLRTMA
jgi:hypothetical protein